MIKNIVFDMGHVLMYFSPKVYISRLDYTGEDAELLEREVYRSADWVALLLVAALAAGVIVLAKFGF